MKLYEILGVLLVRNLRRTHKIRPAL